MHCAPHAGSRLIAPVLILGMLACFAASVRATTMVRIPVDEMTRLADDVVQGTVTSVESRYTDDRSQILTYITVENAEALKGGAGKKVVFVQWGGQVGDDMLRVFGAPSFGVGEDVIVFLSRMDSAEPLAYPTDRWLLGLSQGKWRVATGTDGTPIAVNALLESETLGGEPGAAAPTLPLADFRRQVRNAAALSSLQRMGGN